MIGLNRERLKALGQQQGDRHEKF